MKSKIVQMAVKKYWMLFMSQDSKLYVWIQTEQRLSRSDKKEVYQRISYGKISYIVDADIKRVL